MPSKNCKGMDGASKTTNIWTIHKPTPKLSDQQLEEIKVYRLLEETLITLQMNKHEMEYIRMNGKKQGKKKTIAEIWCVLKITRNARI
jgi:hypothetical protein